MQLSLHYDHLDNILDIPLCEQMLITGLYFSHLLPLGKVDMALGFAFFLQRSIHPIDTPYSMQHCSRGDTVSIRVKKVI